MFLKKPQGLSHTESYFSATTSSSLAAKLTYVITHGIRYRNVTIIRALRIFAHNHNNSTGVLYSTRDLVDASLAESAAAPTVVVVPFGVLGFSLVRPARVLVSATEDFGGGSQEADLRSKVVVNACHLAKFLQNRQKHGAAGYC